MASITGGHLVGKYLSEVEKVNTVFGISGGHIEGILDSFTEYGIRIVDVRHEQAAAMMAHAWSIYNNAPGVCLVTAGPGFTNALTGIVNAYLDNAPLVVISGRHPIRDDLRGALQEMNQIDMVKPVTKWQATCYDTRRIPEYLALAFRHAVTGRPGPVFLELPPDILNVSVETDTVPFPSHNSVDYATLPVMSRLQEAANLINSAKRPVFLGGSGINMSRCDDALKTFIEKSGIPFTLLNNGRGVLPDTHSLSIADGGYTGILTGLPQADVIIAAGIRFNWVLQHGQFFPDAKVIRIDIEPSEINRNRDAAVGLVGDCGAVLEQLTSLIQEKSHDEWIKTLKNAYRAFMTTELELRDKSSDPVHPARLVAQIQEAIGSNAFYVADGGDTCYWGLAGFLSDERAGVLVPAGALLGCLGTGIPFALAAKISFPDKPVVLLQGDGSFGFNSMEFDTAVRHNIPIVCVINNDCCWGMIKHSQELSIGKDRLTCSELGLRNYEKMVEGLGGYGEFVTKDEDIIPAIKRAIDSGKPACVNVVTDNTVTSPATLLFYQNLSDF